jgi:hypothetical protein
MSHHETYSDHPYTEGSIGPIPDIQRSSYCGSGACVGVRPLGEQVLVGDIAETPGGGVDFVAPPLTLSTAAFRSFIGEVAAGGFTSPNA